MAAAAFGQNSTRGIGVYPGDPRQYFGPALTAGPATLRNLALNRAAYHSSSYDFNLTAQLATDGIRTTALPRWLVVSTSQHDVIDKLSRELTLDGNWVSTLELRGRQAWLQLEIAGAEPPEIDHLDVDATVTAPGMDNQIWNCLLLGSDDGKRWRELGRTSGLARPTGEIHPSIKLKIPSKRRYYRVEFDTGRGATWKVGETAFLRNKTKVWLAGPHHFTSAWMPAGTDEEWVSVDLGAESDIERITTAWIRRPAEVAIETSADGKNWKPLGTLSGDELKAPAHARWVRLRTPQAGPLGACILSELGVYGRGGLVAVPHAAAGLSGGNWKLRRASQVAATAEQLSQPGFADASWLVATVPGTVLTSYLNAGAIADPNFGDYQAMASDSFFYSDFWYRNEFKAPKFDATGRAWLDFSGINWKADVYLNGTKLGRIEGAFQRARFDVTRLLRPGLANALAVRIEKPATPGSVKEKTFQSPGLNGGALGADNPTFHASIGWDWIPTVRGRNMGLWNTVALNFTGQVTVENPSVATHVVNAAQADVTLTATLHNHAAAPARGVLQGKLGDITFETPVALDASASKTVTFNPTVANPKLWWPAGYGEPNLYDVELKFVADGKTSDRAAFQAGLREFTTSTEGSALRFWINGRRFIPRGGNWGFGEVMLRYRAREYDAALRYHADMHFNMVRNWVGQIGEDAFYQAADRNGIVIMQDFWLANPWDGPDPDDNAMFLANARDTVLRIRTHPSIGLYCGRNEGYPSKTLNDGIQTLLAELHPGIFYSPSSADDLLSGHGPYRAMPVKSYFEHPPTLLHSEMGMPNIVTLDSLKLMMDESDFWPQGRAWGMHDFSLNGAQGGRSFIERIEKSYGGAKDAAEWVQLAQFVNYEGHRAMFEAQSKNRMGLLIWMSHPTWPSFVWQTYDYFFEPTAAYFACKKAAEPLHIQWNPASDSVEVVNYNAGPQAGLTATAEVFNLDGASRWTKSAQLDSTEDSTVTPISLEWPSGLSGVHFLRLKLTRGDALLSENFYWRGRHNTDFTALRSMPNVKLEASTETRRAGSRWVVITTVKNTGSTPALMVRLKAVRATSRDRILPALYEDNYFALMGGESRRISIELADADTRGEAPAVDVEAFNAAPAK